MGQVFTVDAGVCQCEAVVCLTRGVIIFNFLGKCFLGNELPLIKKCIGGANECTFHLSWPNERCIKALQLRRFFMG